MRLTGILWRYNPRMPMRSYICRGLPKRVLRDDGLEQNLSQDPKKYRDQLVRMKKMEQLQMHGQAVRLTGLRRSS